MAKRLKKIQTARGEASAVIPLSPYATTLSVQYGRSQGIERGDGADWFGPLNPLAPTAPPDVAGRRYDLPVGYNLNQQPRSYELVGFPMMRALADSYDLLRLVIETRKDQVARLNWKFVTSKKDARGRRVEATPGQAKVIDQLTAFFRRPDGVNKWRPWVRSILEDKFVIDAASLYCQRNRGGKLIALKQVDGASVKVLIDDWGRTPQPYVLNGATVVPPAYQQTLKGLPAVNYSTKDLLYRPYNVRVQKPYGYSEVEQIIMTVNIAMRRQVFQLSYYTEGNVPESLIGTPDTWTPEQIVAFQNNWDSMLSGNLAQRRRAKFVPGGIAKTFIATKEPDLKNPMDEWLARVVCFAFSVSPQPFVQMMNRATAGTAQETAKEEGIEPLKEYLKELHDDVAETEFGVEPGDIEFAFEEDVDTDPSTQQDILSKRVEDGIYSINMALEELGHDKSTNPAADQLMVKTPTGYVPIEANTPEAKAAAIKAGLVSDPTAPKIQMMPPGTAGHGAAPGGNEGGDAGGDGAPQPKPGDAPPPKPTPDKEAAKKFAGHEPHAILTPRMRKAARPANAQRNSIRRIPHVPFDRPATVKAERRIKKKIAAALKKVAAGVAADIRRSGVGKVAKAGKKTADQIASDADLSAIDAVVLDVAGDLADAASDTASYALASVGVSEDDGSVFDRVNEVAVDQAQQIAAELVGMRYDEDGNLVPSADAAYRIDESTRDMIRDAITQGLDDNIGNDAIASSIEDSTGFSSDRADLIAHTEIRRANSSAALAGYKGAADAGVNVQKEWLLASDPCPICEDNADDGAIDLDDDFSSGDDAPPAHPNCECAISPVVDDSEDDSGDDSADDEE